MKPSLPQGTRDFSAEVVRKRNYIFNIIRNVFELYGFQPLETPAMENLDTLMGKYGEEGDKLIFRILDSGNPFTKDFMESYQNYVKDFINQIKEINHPLFKEGTHLDNFYEASPELLSKLANNLFNNPDSNKKYLSKFKTEISGKALRYDLTIPFARYVAMNHGQLSFPFKRYQIQPVWRADRPQRGRYREFYQCDADVVGSNSLLNEVELINIYATVFEKLGVDVEIKINSRKILTALAEICGGADKMMDITIAIDKLDKFGIEKVKEELTLRGLNEEQIDIINRYLFISKYSGDNKIVLIELEKLLSNNQNGIDGLNEIKYILAYFKEHAGSFLLSNKLLIDPTLARGLNYYTGCIFEVKALKAQMGSIGGGGRYDDLTGLFGVPNIPGVGISFGVDRIYDVMEELKLFPEAVQTGTQVLFFNLGEAESKTAFGLMQQLRSKGTSCEIFHELAKFDKQFKYADKKNIPFAIIIGTKEMEEGTAVIKNLKTGEQQTLLQKDLPAFSF